MDHKSYSFRSPRAYESVRRMVRGVFLVAPFNVQLMEFDDPKPAPEAIQATTVMCGVCCTDVHMYRGTVLIVRF